MQVELLKPSSRDVPPHSSCLPGTRVAVINGIIDWAIQPASDDTKNILWLHGVAGSGKSTLATTIAKRFYDLERQGAYLFFERAKSLPNLVIRTLAYKLANFDASIGAAISDCLRKDKDIIERSYEDQFEKLLYQPLAKASAKLTGPILIVLHTFQSRIPISNTHRGSAECPR